MTPLWAMIAAAEGQRVRVAVRHRGELADIYVPHDQPNRFRRLLDAEEAQVALVPRRGRSSLLAKGSVLWARIDSAKACTGLERFRFPPTLVVREGRSIRRWALWALARPLDPYDIEQLNRRIASRLGATQKHGETDRMVWMPGAWVAMGRDRRLRCWAEYESDGLFDPQVLDTALPALKDRNAWRDAA